MFFLKICLFILPLILGGVLNMVFVKSKFLNVLKKPIDNNLLFFDGKRIFGNNKTFKGFIGMIVLTSISMSVIYFLGEINNDYLKEIIPYNLKNKSLFTALIYGGILGFGYVLFELPNSFIKRRINIPAGTNATGLIGFIFLVIDQSDSVFGCLILMTVFYVPTFNEAAAILIMASVIHYLVNVMLFHLKLKNQKG